VNSKISLENEGKKVSETRSQNL